VKLETFVVGVDFSEPSERAFATARELARRVQARIHLVHAFHVPVQGPMPEMVIFPPDALTSYREAATRSLQKLLDELAASGIEGHLHLAPGHPASVIADIARAVGADLVVVGTRGRTGLPHVLLGSVAERVLRIAPCPVLTVH
jgi:nucleotide-binding universal stress UspA family protein